MFTLTNLALALLLINAITFVLFGWDKMMAEAGTWRVSEATLLGWSLIGGIGGAYAGRQVFRHKTRKQSFGNSLQTISLLQLGALTFGTVFFFPSGTGEVRADVSSDPSPDMSANVQTVMTKTGRFAYYPNCDSARAAGVAPLYRGDPGYRSRLDADDDGIACEPYYGR